MKNTLSQKTIEDIPDGIILFPENATHTERETIYGIIQKLLRPGQPCDSCIGHIYPQVFVHEDSPEEGEQILTIFFDQEFTGDKDATLEMVRDAIPEGTTLMTQKELLGDGRYFLVSFNVKVNDTAKIAREWQAKAIEIVNEGHGTFIEAYIYLKGLKAYAFYPLLDDHYDTFTKHLWRITDQMLIEKITCVKPVPDL